MRKTVGECTEADRKLLAKFLELLDPVMVADICENSEVSPYETWDAILRFCKEEGEK